MTEYINPVNVSVIIPILNGEKWINRCFESIISQIALENNFLLEVSVFNDASTDKTQEILAEWNNVFTAKNIKFTLTENNTGSPKGVGYAKNAAVKASSGEYLCFQDIDDVMLPERIFRQYTESQDRKKYIIGSKFLREPLNSTERFTNWANNLSQAKLNLQIYTSHGPTVIMPTWFFHRDIFERLNGFSEESKGIPEDLIFFYKHLDKGGKVYRVDEVLVIYTYHLDSATFNVSSDTIWNIQIQHLANHFMQQCQEGFTVWNGGKQGRKFLKSLNVDQRALVKALCDVDTKKIGRYYELYCPIERKVIIKIPIIHYKDAKPPFIICMKLDLTNGEFENNLKSLNLEEGKDYILFS